VTTLHQEIVQLDAQACFRPRKCRPCSPSCQRKKNAPAVLSRQVHVGRRPPVIHTLHRKNSAIRARGGFSRRAPSATARPHLCIENPTLTNLTPTHSNPYTTHMSSLFVQKGLFIFSHELRRLAACVVGRENSADEPGRVAAVEREESVVLFSFE